MPEQQGQIGIKENIRVVEPEMFDVIFLNDDFTTMDFVVKVLKQVFFHTDVEAEALMLDIHHTGQCIVGTYTFDIAQSKVNKTTRLAREEGFPLRLKIQKHK